MLIGLNVSANVIGRYIEMLPCPDWLDIIGPDSFGSELLHPLIRIL